MKQYELANQLMEWYHLNKRDLPWRNTNNPYHIWLSEIMLQQTRVEAVLPYYHRFLEALPTIEALSQASDEQLHKLWQGLGYYRRVIHMKQAAIQCCTFYNGKLPNTYEQLLELKGIGPYCASAIASFAFHLHYPVVDGNVIRVCARLWRKQDTYETEKKKSELAQELMKWIPKGQCDTFNQAIMELGATICIPNGTPRCHICPWQKVCEAFQHQEIEEYPRSKKKIERKIEKYKLIILQNEDKIHLNKRDEQGLLAGLYQFELFEDTKSFEEILFQYAPYGIKQWQQLPPKQHIFTHKEWHLDTYLIHLTTAIEGLWVNRSEIETKYPIASAFETYLKYISF